MNGIKLFLCVVFSLFGMVLFAQVQKTKTIDLMGSVFQITLVAADSISAYNAIDSAIEEIERIENLISEWRPHTQISRVNQNAGIQPVKVDKEVFELTKKAIWFSEITNGAFDISIAAMDKVWFFDDSMEKLPSRKALKHATRKVNYKNIILNEAASTIFLTKKGMKIGFGSIGKGYAADKGRALMQALGIKAGIINAAGDLATWGAQINGSPWKIGLRNPFETGSVLDVIECSNNEAITTSGNYEKYAEIGGKRYAHIINPKTGMPSAELVSVTIRGKKAEMCNGFSTSVMVLGLKKGLKLLEKHPDYRYVIITNDGKIIRSTLSN